MIPRCLRMSRGLTSGTTRGTSGSIRKRSSYPRRRHRPARRSGSTRARPSRRARKHDLDALERLGRRAVGSDGSCRGRSPSCPRSAPKPGTGSRRSGTRAPPAAGSSARQPRHWRRPPRHASQSGSGEETSLVRLGSAGEGKGSAAGPIPGAHRGGVHWRAGCAGDPSIRLPTGHQVYNTNRRARTPPSPRRHSQLSSHDTVRLEWVRGEAGRCGADPRRDGGRCVESARNRQRRARTRPVLEAQAIAAGHRGVLRAGQRRHGAGRAERRDRARRHPWPGPVRQEGGHRPDGGRAGRAAGQGDRRPLPARGAEDLRPAAARRPSSRGARSSPRS